MRWFEVSATTTFPVGPTPTPSRASNLPLITHLPAGAKMRRRHVPRGAPRDAPGGPHPHPAGPDNLPGSRPIAAELEEKVPVGVEDLNTVAGPTRHEDRSAGAHRDAGGSAGPAG